MSFYYVEKRLKKGWIVNDMDFRKCMMNNTCKTCSDNYKCNGGVKKKKKNKRKRKENDRIA